MGRNEARARGRAYGRHEHASSVRVDGLNDAIMEALSEYGDVIYQATEEGLDAAAYTLMGELRSATPGSTPHKQNLAKRWKVKRYTLSRYVGNSTVVKGKSGEETSLINILEYSTTKGKPFVKQTFEASINKMVAAVVAEIKNTGG